LVDEPKAAPQPALAKTSLDNFEHVIWKHPADAELLDAETARPPVAAPTGAERLAAASRVAQERMPETGQSPASSAPVSPRPAVPPSGAGPERWEQLLRRYRENLDLDWDERTWRTKDKDAASGDSEPEGRKPAPK
jgi:hypothetical protein